MSESVKRCPLCGGVPKVCTMHRGKDMNLFWIRCTRCNTRTTSHEDYGAAVAEWNRRAK